MTEMYNNKEPNQNVYHPDEGFTSVPNGLIRDTMIALMDAIHPDRAVSSHRACNLIEVLDACMIDNGWAIEGGEIERTKDLDEEQRDFHCARIDIEIDANETEQEPE